jgi:hypothetical protein
MMMVRQKYAATAPLDVPQVVRRELSRIADAIKPGMRIAVGTGSRGITNILPIVESTVQFVKELGAKPFIIPAMGSHGGATAEGQIEVLASYGVTEARLGVPIEASMDAVQIGTTESGWPVFFSVPARQADGILAINRVKPHTDFRSDTIGSGVLKMMVIGFGKRAGAANFHRTALHHGFEPVLRAMAGVILRSTPLLCGVAIVENQTHETAEIAVLPRDHMESGEAKLFARAKALMPKLPFDEIDLLIIDRIGKNISGSGMDPNIIGREVHGYSTSFEVQKKQSPIVRRLFVRDLTPETHGNAIGIGLADLTTTRLGRATDTNKTNINALTSLTPNCAKIPIQFESDREAISQALNTLGLANTSEAKVVRIADTLSLQRVSVSDAFTGDMRERTDLEVEAEPTDMCFDPSGNLLDL